MVHRTWDPGSGIPGPGSRIRDLGSRIPDRGSQLRDPGSRIGSTASDPGSKLNISCSSKGRTWYTGPGIPNPGSRESRVLDLGSAIWDPGSRIGDPRFGSPDRIYGFRSGIQVEYFLPV